MEKVGDVRIPRAAMNKLVMNYLVTEGFKDAAERFQDEAGVTAGSDLSLLDNRIKIRDNIQSGARTIQIQITSPPSSGRWSAA